MPHAHTEDQLVERHAIKSFAEPGWTTVSAMEEVLGFGGTLSRDTSREVVLVLIPFSASYMALMASVRFDAPFNRIRFFSLIPVSGSTTIA